MALQRQQKIRSQEDKISEAPHPLYRTDLLEQLLTGLRSTSMVLEGSVTGASEVEADNTDVG